MDTPATHRNLLAWREAMDLVETVSVAQCNRVGILVRTLRKSRKNHGLASKDWSRDTPLCRQPSVAKRRHSAKRRQSSRFSGTQREPFAAAPEQHDGDREVEQVPGESVQECGVVGPGRVEDAARHPAAERHP